MGLRVVEILTKLSLGLVLQPRKSTKQNTFQANLSQAKRNRRCTRGQAQ